MAEKKIQRILEVLKPGDVILTDGRIHWEFDFKKIIKNIGLLIAYNSIRKFQKDVFYNNPPSLIKGIYCNTHVALFLGHENIMKYIGSSKKVIDNLMKYPQADIFSCEPPKALLIESRNIVSDRISIYRRTNKILNDNDIEIQCKIAEKMLETPYDIKDLISIADAISSGTPFERKGTLFPVGSNINNRVCSTSITIIQKLWRDEIEKLGIKINRDFSILNNSAWNKKFINDFNSDERGKLKGKWDSESVMPDNFSNSISHFNGEWKLVN